MQPWTFESIIEIGSALASPGSGLSLSPYLSERQVRIIRLEDGFKQVPLLLCKCLAAQESVSTTWHATAQKESADQSPRTQRC